MLLYFIAWFVFHLTCSFIVLIDADVHTLYGLVKHMNHVKIKIWINNSFLFRINYSFSSRDLNQMPTR